MKMFILNIPANQGHSLMRNLSLFRKRLITGISGAVYLVEDYDHFYVFKEGPLDSLARVNKQTQAMTELVVVCEGPLESSTVVGAHIHPSERTLLVALASGEICFYHIDDEAAVGKVLGSFPSGILAMATSPDDELVALINGGLQVIIMQRSSLSVLCEISLATAVGSFTAENVTVGWGKKETQFHGSVGKQAALTKVTVHEEITPGDDRGVRLSWRQDAAHLAVSFVTEQDCTPFRQICIMNRDGQVSAVKEPTAELGSTLAWRRDGGLIAASRKCGEETKLVFFERNGLQHGEFSLKGDVKELAWNCDGSILATTMSNGSVDLWTTGNYHWYHKFSIPSADGIIPTIFWDAGSPMSMSILRSGCLNRYEFSRSVDRTKCDLKDALCMVAVVDGNFLLLTPFEVANVPPPMAFATINVNSVSNCVALLSIGIRALLAVATPQKQVHIYELMIENRKLASNLITSIDHPMPLRQLVFVSPESLYGLTEDDQVVYIHQNTLNQVPLSGINLIAQAGELCLYTDSGDMYHWKSGENPNSEFLAHIEAPVTPYMDYIITKDTQWHVRLQESVLTVNHVEVTRNCTSFLVHPEFLCTTDPEGMVHFYPLDTNLEDWPQMHNMAGEEHRRLTEGGAICIAAVPRTAALIVQMPRGNLETVYPRAFVLSQVRKRLNALSYREAFLLCRRHRIDLNILHDNAPELFISTLNKLVQDVSEVDYLNLIMSGLCPENVVVTRYGSFMKDTATLPREYPDKVNSVCDALRGILSADPVKYAECIMTALVCRVPPNHEAALQMIVDLANSTPDAVEKALKYLIFLVPAERLYRVALGMYALPLALSVARRSQMDPSEYVSFLEELHRQDEYHRKFKIDDYLQRYDRALTNLVATGCNFGECLQYISRHELYSVAIKVYEGRDEFKELCSAYGEYLMEKDDAGAALDMFMHAGEYEEATICAIKCGNWRKVMILNSKVDTDRDKMNMELVLEKLVEQKRFAEALYVAELSVGNEEALKIAIKGHLWSDAARIVQTNKMDVTPLYQAALSYRMSILEELTKVSTDFVESSSRLERVQSDLVTELDPTRIRIAMESSTGNILDGASEISFRTTTSFAGTVISNLSRVSLSKSKKKADKQRMRGKPGSPFEREYLRDRIRESIQRIILLRKDSTDLIQLLADEAYFSDARELQNAFDTLCITITVTCDRLKKLVKSQEDKMGPEVLAALGMTPFSVPTTLQVDHVWRTAFDLPADFSIVGRLEYL